MAKRKSSGPVTLKEALSENVQTQQRRSKYTKTPPEAQRSPRERIRSASKRKQASQRGANQR